MSSLFELVSGTGARDNLSRYGDTFVGRRLMLERVASALDDDRIVVLLGPPGVGKSRLANEYGRRFLSAHPGAGAWFCDLTACRTHAEVLAAVGRALGLRFGAADPEEAALQRIGEVLASLGPTLLIVDNAEGAPDFVAECVAAWDTKTLRVLVTSRRALDELPSVDLRPLASVEALTLLEDRIRRLRPDFRATDQTRDDLRRLATELDGLPLALELVAPRLRLLSPAQLLSRLDLSEGPLEAALQRSWELLDEPERRAFAQTSLFRGGFDVPAAEAVVSLDDRPVIDLLDDLVDHSLARLTSTPEFPDETRLDYPVAVREFARARLAESDDEDAVMRRHIDYFVQHGERWDAGIDTGDEKESTRRLVVELPNLTAAWERADGGARVRLGLVLHLALQRGGAFDRQFEVTEETVDGARRLGDERFLGRALLARARAQRWRNDFDASLEDLEEALAHARLADDLQTECSALRNLAAGHWGAGDPQRTSQYADEALQVALRSGNPIEEINARNGLGFLLAHTGELDAAQRELENALALARQQEKTPGLIALVSSSLAALMTLRGQFDEAEFYSTQALELYRELDYVRSIPMELLGRAEARCASGKVDAARADVQQTLELTRRMGFRTVRLRARHVATLVELLDDNLPAALDHIARAVAGTDRAGDQMLLLGARLYEVVARSLLGQLPQAERAREAAQELIEGNGPGRWENLADVADGFLELARADDADDPEPHLSAAAEHAASGYEDDAVASALARVLAERLPRTPRFRITDDGRAFSPPTGEPVDITRRKALRGILQLLADFRRDTPGEPATLDDVLEAGWPGEVMTHESGKRRVYVSVKRLRDLGLEELLVTAGDGYMLDPNVPIEFVESM